MGPFFVLTSLGFGFVAVLSTAIGSDCRYLGRRSWLTRYALAAVGIAVLGAVITYSGSSNLLAAAWVLVGLSVAIMGNFPFYNHMHTQRAVTYLAHANRVRAWGLANFDRITSADRDYITSSDLERVLRNSATLDEDRRIIGWLIDHMREVGREMEVFRTYSVSIDVTVVETPITNQVYGISRSDFESYPERARRETVVGGWLPANT